MPRARFGVARLRKKNKLLRRVKGFRGGRGKLLRTAKEARARAEAYATRHRRKKKGDWRRLWIVRINAAIPDSVSVTGTILKTASRMEA